MQDVTWLVFVKTFWTRITSVFFLVRHYHRICYQLNIFGMNSVDVSKSIGNTTGAAWRTCARVEQRPTRLIQRLIGSMRRRCESVVAARGGHTRYWTLQTSILHDNFCLSMICSDNDVEKFCWYCLICYAHMNLNYTIFVDFFSLCKTYWASNPCIVSFVDLLSNIYNRIEHKFYNLYEVLSSIIQT